VCAPLAGPRPTLHPARVSYQVPPNGLRPPQGAPGSQVAPTEGEETWVLFETPWCGYCRRVRQAASRLGITLAGRDVSNDAAARSELMAARGRSTVPVLRRQRADGSVSWLPESEDIIRMLEQRLGG
jgi:glutaredoxin